MDPIKTASNFRDFLKQISKYLQNQDKEEEKETQDQGIFKMQKLPTVIEENDYTEWYKLTVIPYYLVQSQI